MVKKIFNTLIIVASILLIIPINNCYAANSNGLKTAPLPPPPPATSPASTNSTTNNKTTTQNTQDANTIDKLFDQAGYQYFKINKEIDSEKNYPKLFKIPDGNGNEDTDDNQE